MAILDSRLLPFIDMLAELGIDWLAFELFEGIRRGEELAEDEDALARARQRIGADDPEEPGHDSSADDEGRPFAADDQLEWVVQYVCVRLEATLAAMSDSLDAVDEIVGAPAEPPRSGDSQPSAVLMLLGDDEERADGRSQVESARGRLPELRQALDAWLDGERTDPVR